MNESFPYLIIPNRIIEIREGINILPKKPDEPVEPKRLNEKKPKFNPAVFIYPIVGLIFLSFNLYIITIILFVIFIAGIVLYNSDKNQYENNRVQYKNSIIHYENEKRNFLKEIDKYNAFIENLKNPQYLAQFKNDLILNFFKGTYTFKVDFSNKKGIAENNFHNKLQQYFGNEIYINKAIENINTKTKYVSVRDYMDKNPDSYDSILYEYGGTFEDVVKYNPYCPDFIFKHSKSNLHIDIEIDEPYSNNKPIHYLNNISDSKRNSYFNNHRWIVVRFAEEQVILYGDECCYFIASLIKAYSNDSSYLSEFTNPLFLKKIPIWTIEEAKDMIKANYRNTYISKLN